MTQREQSLKFLENIIHFAKETMEYIEAMPEDTIDIPPMLATDIRANAHNMDNMFEEFIGGYQI